VICSTSLIASSTLSPVLVRFMFNLLLFSAIDTKSPGQVDRSEVLRVLQASGENYDLARETLKHVSVDASGKLELEDWVEVKISNNLCAILTDPSSATCETEIFPTWNSDESRQGHRSRLKC
jgi:plastin-1